MKSKLELAAEAAQQRVDKRKRAAEKARLEELRAKTDAFLSMLPAELEKAKKKKEPVCYSVPDNEYRYDQQEKKYFATGATKFLQETCIKLGLKAVLRAHSDTVEYRSYEWAVLEISR